MKIILITIDCLRYDYTGHLLNVIPENWGKIVFHKHYTNAPYTWGAFPAIFTSTPPFIMGNPTLKGRLSFVEILSSKEYLTIGINGGNPYLSSKKYSRLFDIYIDMFNSSNEQYSDRNSIIENVGKTVINYAKKISSGLGLIVDSLLERANYSIKNITSKGRYPLFDSLTTTNDVIKSLMKAQITPNNVFLWVHYMDLHFPYASYVRIRKGVMYTSKLIWDYIGYESMGSLTTNISNFKKMYEMSLDYVLFSLKLLFKYLDEISRDNNIYVIITSDHGEEFGEHGGLGHEGIRRSGLKIPHLYEELIHVPLIITSPDISKTKNVSDILTSHLDLAPTIIELAEAKLPERIRSLFWGQSLMHKMYTDKEDMQVYIESEAILTSLLSSRTRRGYLAFAIREGKYKYIYHPVLGEELYDLHKDPFEKKNIALYTPDVTHYFRQELKKYLTLRQKLGLKYKINLMLSRVLKP